MNQKPVYSHTPSRDNTTLQNRQLRPSYPPVSRIAVPTRNSCQLSHLLLSVTNLHENCIASACCHPLAICVTIINSDEALDLVFI
jgi:hypothetical protein